MKIQSLAIIFIIIILPISIILSEYLRIQINTLNLQTSYDSRLTAATYDAVRAFQLNSLNSSTNDLTGTKIRDIEASAKIFLTSIANNFGEGGADTKGIQSYVPAIVYCLYDGYYIYSPYKNDLGDEINNKIKDAEDYAYEHLDRKEEKYKYHDGDTLTGVKPYIYYSCRYKKGATDVVITYSLDNYIVVQGMVGGTYWNESGYILDGVSVNGDTVKYNDVMIPKKETLSENIFDPELSDKMSYPYAKINGTKYYLDTDNKVFYMQNGKKMYGPSENNLFYYYRKITGENYADDTEGKYNHINSNAYQFYKSAYDFTQKVRSSELNNLTFGDAKDIDGNSIDANGFKGSTKIFSKVSNVNAEYSNSNFAEHRVAVIRYVIEKNLSTAIANYNNNFAIGTAAFAMPNLSETDWYKIINNVSMITFLQGLPIGGKIYNGYSVVTNNKNEDFVADESIFITYNNQYHRFDDKDLQGKSGLNGYLNLDFERHSDDQKNYYYPREEEGCYSSIVNQSNIAEYDNIYSYLSANPSIAQAYYNALGREKYGMYRYIPIDPTDTP